MNDEAKKALTEMCIICKTRPKAGKYTCEVCHDEMAEAFAVGVKGIVDRVKASKGSPRCPKCDDLKEKGLCPAICEGSKKELKRGMGLLKENQNADNS